MKLLQAPICIALTGFCLLAAPAFGQVALTEHTFRLDADAERPPATLDEASWLVGSWRGEAFGNTFEQVWNPPSAGSMVGFFKLLNDDGVVFYELLLLVEEAGSLSLKVKHFSADFTAWEDKSENVTFRFIEAEPDALHFSGISFYRIDANTMHAYLVMRSGDDVREEQLVYRRN